MRPLRGSFWVLVLYDVAEQIQLDKLRTLIGVEPVKPQPSFKHPAPEYVRFERPPVVEFPEPVVIQTGERFDVQIKYYDYGSERDFGLASIDPHLRVARYASTDAEPNVRMERVMRPELTDRILWLWSRRRRSTPTRTRRNLATAQSIRAAKMEHASGLEDRLCRHW